MRERAPGKASGTAAHRADDAAARTPGKATLHPGHGHAVQPSKPAAARASAFDGAQWEDIPAHEHAHAPAAAHPEPAADGKVNVNAHEAHAASATGDDDALDHHDAAHGHAQPGEAAPQADTGGIHIITRGGLRHLRHAGPKGRHAAEVLYNNPNAYIVLKEGQSLPRGWKAKATILFPSYKDFRAAHEAGRIPRGTGAVVYDNEHWQQTPPNEKRDAAHFAKLFGELAHQLNLTFIAAPTQKWFAPDARFADIIDLQLQGRESHAKAYAHAVKQDASYAHRVNPNIEVVAQISSNKNHLRPGDPGGSLTPGARTAEHDILDNAPYLDGFWGYLYQQNSRSVHAGQHILEDLAAHEGPYGHDQPAHAPHDHHRKQRG